MAENSLSAAIAGNLAAQDAQKTAAAKRAKPVPQAEPPKVKSQPGRSGTVLVGGHFRPAVKQQLRIIAAEEATTSQALLEEALDLLFIKKGRAKIESL